MLSLKNLEKVKPFFEKISRGERDLNSFSKFLKEENLSRNEKKVLSRLLIESITFKNRNRYIIEFFSKKSKRNFYKNDIKLFFAINSLLRGLPRRFDLVEERNLIVKLLKKNKYKLLKDFLENEYIENLKGLKEKDLVKFYEVTQSHPGWFIKNLFKDLGNEKSIKILKYNNLEPFIYFKGGLQEGKIPLEDFLIEGVFSSSKILFSTFHDFYFKSLSPKKGEKILICGDKISSTHVSYLITKGVRIFIISEKNFKKDENIEFVKLKEVEKISPDRIIFLTKSSECGNWRNKVELRWTITPEIAKKRREKNLEELLKILKNVKGRCQAEIVSESILDFENGALLKMLKRNLRIRSIKRGDFEKIAFRKGMGYLFLPSKLLDISGGFVSILEKF